MSVYKNLIIENQKLRTQLLRAQQDIERLKEALAMEADWISPQELNRPRFALHGGQRRRHYYVCYQARKLGNQVNNSLPTDGRKIRPRHA